MPGSLCSLVYVVDHACAVTAQMSLVSVTVVRHAYLFGCISIAKALIVVSSYLGALILRGLIVLIRYAPGMPLSST